MNEITKDTYEKIADALNFQLIVANATHSGGVFINSESAHIIMSLLVEKLENMKGGVTYGKQSHSS